MEQLIDQKLTPFVDRRSSSPDARSDGPERRQFSNSYENERPEVAEMAQAIDQYKLRHRRRFITYAELYDVIAGLGYQKPLAD